ncbi:MAG: DUF3604 domain-containing protein [bacterium]
MSPLVAAQTCPGTVSGAKNIYWGDLHVHSGYSLDAWGYGTASTPAQAYAFARGAPIALPDGTTVSMPRPLDFMAVTDHAEWFNLMYVCTDPMASAHPYCDILTEKNTPQTGSEVFANYVLPTITEASPAPTPLCEERPELCASAHLSQWQRVQDQANEANDPCRFTSFIAFEWSATPDFSHNHRNLIFANENVTPDAIDYMRFPTPHKLWEQLERQCLPENGCDVIAIPHNTNMGDGRSFDVETESPDELALRARYERLVEIHQEKGNSECLSAFGQTDEDCSFELYLTKNSVPTEADGYLEAEWEQMRSGYVRRLLLRGLYGYQQSGARMLNPLQLGIIGSTDNHSGTGGFVDEETWPGTVFGYGNFDRTMLRVDWNPGGLVAVWAEENTRQSIFAALKRREVYATSGPRLRVRLDAQTQPLGCGDETLQNAVPMGGVLSQVENAFFRIQVQADHSPVGTVQMIKGYLEEGELREEVVELWHNKDGAADVCVSWHDENLNKQEPAFWYARVLQVPTPRWSAYRCRREGRCDDFPKADRWIRERAWTSPIWHLPGADGE